MTMQSLMKMNLDATPATQTQQQVPTQQAPATQGTPSPAQQMHNSTVNTEATPPNAPSPLEQWGKVFNNEATPTQNAATPEGQPAPAATPEVDTAPRLPTSQELQAGMAKHNFLGGIDQAKVTAAIGGDESAFMEVLGAVARNSAAASSSISMAAINPVMEHQMNTAKTSAVSDASNNVKVSTVNAVLESKNPTKYANPVLKPTIDNLTQQYMKTYPQATPNEIANAVDAYMDQAFSSNAPAQQTNENDGWDQ